VYYKVGSRDERQGRTGFAHLFEHLMCSTAPKTMMTSTWHLYRMLVDL
jgi:predicted Zn-dependent peptidase